MFDHAQINALSAVLRLGSFDAAATELNVTPSAISQRVRALEERVGAVLVIRSQPCAATEAGARVARHAEAVALLEQGLAADLGQPARTAATVRIAVNADSLATWFLPALAEVPGMLFDLVVDDQDHSAELLRKGDVAAAVTALEGAVQGCDSLALGRLRYRATASPGFVARHCPGLTPEEIARAPGLTFNAKDRLQADWLKARAGRRAGFPTHMIPSSQGFVEAALLGLGWGMNPEALVGGHLRAGRLIDLAPDAPLDVGLTWQASRMTAAAIRPLTRAVRAAAARVLIA